MKANLLVIFSIFISLTAYSQDNVGIGTTTPNASAILDLTTINKGFLAPRLTSAQRIAVASPATGLLVFDTNFNEFWYFDGVVWRPLSSSNQWSLTGNTATDPLVNFIGTTDIQPFIIKTSGSLPVNERLRVLPNGQITVNNPVPFQSDIFSVYGTGTVGAINPLGTYSICGYSDSLSVGIFGQNTGAGLGVWGDSRNLGQGVYGSNDNDGGGVWGDNTGNGVGVRGQSHNSGIGALGTNDNNGYGVYGYNTSIGIGVIGVNADSFPGAGHGVYGQSSYLQSFGVYGYNTDLLGTGVVGVGNNNLPAYLASGSGSASTGQYIGVFGKALLTSNNDTTAGGYFVAGSSYAYVGAFDGSLNRKIVGNGTVNTIVKDINDKPVLLSAPEAPENLFNDYGSGQLQNGKAKIVLDPTLSKNISVTDKHPLRVFIQLEGNCKGVYVTNKSQTGFEVIELDYGTSNAQFTWFVSANRADEVGSNGTVLKNCEERFGKAPVPLIEKK